MNQESGINIESPRGRFVLASCCSGTTFARTMETGLKTSLREGHIPTLFDIDFRFSDQETCARLERDVNGSDVFLIQSLVNPCFPQSIDQNYTAFFVGVHVFKEWGANSVTAVLPYLAYARQDRPTRSQQEPTTAKLMADLSVTAGADRLVTWHPHSAHIRGFYGGIPVDFLDPVEFFAAEFKEFYGRDDVIAVSPDAGALNFVTQCARSLKIPQAMALKYRPRAEKAEVTEMMGDFSGKKTAIILDDLVSTGGTIEALIKKLVDRHVEKIYLGVSHNLCLDGAYRRLADLHRNYRLQKVVVTNSISQTEPFLSLPFFHVRSIEDVFVEVITQIHFNRSVTIGRYW